MTDPVNACVVVHMWNSAQHRVEFFNKGCEAGDPIGWLVHHPDTAEPILYLVEGDMHVSLGDNYPSVSAAASFLNGMRFMRAKVHAIVCEEAEKNGVPA